MDFRNQFSIESGARPDHCVLKPRKGFVYFNFGLFALFGIFYVCGMEWILILYKRLGVKIHIIKIFN